MNILIYWKTEREYLIALLKKFHGDKLIYMDDKESLNFKDEDNGLQFINLLVEIDKLYDETKIVYLLDADLIKKMEPYESAGMGIINRWRRSIASDESYLSLKNAYYKYMQFWYDFLMKNHISLFVLATCEPHVPMTYFPYVICKAMNIPTIIMGNLAIVDKKKINYYLETGLNDLGIGFKNRYIALQEKYEKSDQEIPLRNELDVYFEMYGQKNEDVNNVIIYNEKDDLISIVNKYLSRAKIYLSQGRYKILLKKIKYYLLADINSKPLLNYIKKMEHMPKEEKYFIFFLHLQPEATTLPKAGCYEDQLLAVRILSRNLPKGIRLYIKEHPAYWSMKNRHEDIYESRNKFFYNEISKLSNVRLIDHTYDSLTLMDHSLAVVTMVGTAGFEAIFKGIPVITFAEASYSKYKYVYNVRTNKDCKMAIDNILADRFHGELRDVRIFLKALEGNVLPYGCEEPSYVENGTPRPDEEDYQNFIDMVYNFYKINYSKT